MDRVFAVCALALVVGFVRFLRAYIPILWIRAAWLAAAGVMVGYGVTHPDERVFALLVILAGATLLPSTSSTPAS